MAEIFWHNLPKEEIIKILRSDIEKGLTEKEAEIRQREFGKNQLPEEKPLSKLKIFLGQFQSPLIYILVIAGIITLILRDFTDAIVIFGAVFLNTIIGFFQENKTSKILSELKKVIKVKAYVIREGNEKEIEQSELVPGDIFLLKTGNKVPADARLVDVHNLKINEAALTGEWLPAEKKTEILSEKTSLADRDNMVYMGCVVEEGEGKAVVTDIGLETEIGKVAKIIKEVKEEKTPYQKRIIYLSKIIGFLIILLCLFIFGLGIATGKEVFEMFLTSVAVAVAAIPEGLPAAITVILALGMQRVLKKRGLVRQMVAAETLGSTSIICTDKTGTLTEAKMEVAGIYTGTKELLSDGGKYTEKVNKNSAASHILALKIATLCSEAFIENLQEPLEKWIVRGRPTDRALLLAGIQAGLNKKELEREQPKIDELSFDPVYKYSATLSRLSESESILYVLGAPEKILEQSKYLDVDGKVEILTEEKLKELEKKFENLAEKGQRVLSTAYRILRITNLNELRIENEIKDLTFVGFIGLHDPLRKEVKGAIKICRQAGMRPIIVTGDHKLTAKAIALELGLPAKEENIIEGAELEKLSEEEFQKRLEKIEIYARVEPIQKLKIIDAWQKRGEVVAMTGDGINDAPALKKADIGLALGSGTDCAKESSDLILLTDNFSIIVAAVEEGRVIIDNIRKTVTLLVSQCSSEIILIGASIIGGLPLPILPAQILWENLIEGSPQGIALAFEPKEKDVMKRKPENPKSPLLTPQMKTIILGFGLVTDLILFGLFLWLYKIWGLERLPEIRTIIFAALAIDTIFYAFSCKNLRKNIWQYNLLSNLYLIGCIIFSILMLLMAIYLPPLQNLLKTIPLNFFHWSLLLGLGIINLILIEVIKWYFITKRKVKNVI